VALGATALRGVFGRPLTVTKMRGEIHELGDTHALVTIHPSYLLRIDDAHDKAAEYHRFVDELKLGVKFLKR
jgi:uracil-DNA glycosylase